MRTEEPGSPDILQVEELAPLIAGAPTCVIGAGVHGTRAGGGRGSSHGFSLRKAPFINTINGVASVLCERLNDLKLIHSLGRHAVRFSPSTTVFLRVLLDRRVSKNFTPYRYYWLHPVQFRALLQDIEFSSWHKLKNACVNNFFYRKTIIKYTDTDTKWQR